MSYLENQTRPNKFETYYIRRGETLVVGSPLIIYSPERLSEFKITVDQYAGLPAAIMELNNRNTGGLNLRGYQVQILGYQDDASIYFQSPTTAYPTFDFYAFGATFNVPVIFCNRQYINPTNMFIAQANNSNGGIYWEGPHYPLANSFGTIEYNFATGVPDRLNIYTSPNATAGGVPVALQSNLLVYSDGLSTTATSCNFLANLSANNLKMSQTSQSQPFATAGDVLIRASPFASGFNCMDSFLRVGAGLTVGYNWYVSDASGSYKYAQILGGANPIDPTQATFTICNAALSNLAVSNVTTSTTFQQSVGFSNGLTVFAGTTTLNGSISVGGQLLINSGVSTPLFRSGLSLCNLNAGYSGISFNGTLPPTTISSTPFFTGSVSVGNAAGLISTFTLPALWSNANAIQICIAGTNTSPAQNRVSSYNTSFTYNQSGGSIGPPDGTWFFITGSNTGAFSTANYANSLPSTQILATLPSLSTYNSTFQQYPDDGNTAAITVNWPAPFVLCPRTLPTAGVFYVWCSLHNPSSHGGVINFDAFSLQATLTYLA